MCLQKRENYGLHVSIRLDFCYITLLRGPTASVPTVDSEVPPAFLLIRLTTHRCLRAVQETEGRAGPGPRGSGCLSQVNKCVWSEIREGRTQTKKFQQRSSCGSCGSRSTKDAGQLEQSHWPVRACGRVLAVVSFLCVILNERSDNSSETGCPIGRPIPRVDRGPCSWPLNDLGSNKS